LQAAGEYYCGASSQGVAETFFYCRRPLRRFVDIGSGPGYLLDALSLLLPDAPHTFTDSNYFLPAKKTVRAIRITTPLCCRKMPGTNSTQGVCIEVIEHLTPATLGCLPRDFADVSNPGALYLFNSGQPSYVRREDPGYLDPLQRGHIVSYGIKGLPPLRTPASTRSPCRAATGPFSPNSLPRVPAKTRSTICSHGISPHCRRTLRP